MSHADTTSNNFDEYHPINFWVHFCTWACYIYGIFVCLLGIALPMAFNQRLYKDEHILSDLYGFYCILYILSILCLLAIYVVTQNSNAKRKDRHGCRSWCKSMWHSLLTSITCEVEVEEEKHHPSGYRISPSSGVGQNPALPKPSNGHSKPKPTGRLGLRIGLKVFSLFNIVILILQLTQYVELRVQGNQCLNATKPVMFVLQFFYVVLLTQFLLNNVKAQLDEHPVLAHFCVAHLFATTFCTGIYHVIWHTLLTMRDWHANLADKLDHEEHKELPFFTNNRTNEAPGNACQLQSYLEEVQLSIGNYVFVFCMHFVFSACIILAFLFMRYLQISQGRLTLTLLAVRAAEAVESSFTAAAGLTMIVGSIVVTVLSVSAMDSYIIHIYLLLLHGHANVLFAIMLYRMRPLAYDRNKDVRGDYGILIAFLFAVCMLNILVHMSNDFKGDASFADYLELAASIVEVMQALMQVVFLLVALRIYVKNETQKRLLPSSNMLTHLTSTNVAAFILSIFMTKVQTFEISEYIAEEGGEADNALIWMVLGNVLVPCQSFFRFYCIILFVEVKKIVLKESSSEPPNGADFHETDTFPSTNGYKSTCAPKEAILNTHL